MDKGFGLLFYLKKGATNAQMSYTSTSESQSIVLQRKLVLTENAI
jgi:hypothetical protein